MKREITSPFMPNSFVFDVSEIEIRPSMKLRCKERLPLLAFTDEDGWYKVHVPGLGRSISAPTRAGLVDALKEMIAAFWQQYAGEDDTNLTPRARRLKAGLLQHYAETR